MDDGILDLAELVLDAELEEKRRRVEQCFRKVGVTATVPTPEASPRRCGARARIQLRLGPSGRFEMHRRGSHVAVAPPIKAMAREAIARVVPDVEAWFVQRPDVAARIERLALRTNDRRVVAVLTTRKPKSVGKWEVADLVEALGADGAVAIGRRAAAGDPAMNFDVDGVSLSFGPTSFFQVNPEVNTVLVACIRRWVAVLEPEHVLDLYAGAGNLSVPLALDGHRVTLVEAGAAACQDARENLKRHGLSDRVIERDAGKLEAGEVFADVIVLDPPRGGSGSLVTRLALARPRAFVFVSCNPPMLARDLREVTRLGYRVEEVVLHDMFPLTSHVEVLALVTRADISSTTTLRRA